MTTPTDKLAALQALIGHEWRFTAPEELGAAAIRKYALALGDRNPLYRDAAYARETAWAGIIAPPTFVCETWQYMDGAIDAEGAFINPLQDMLTGAIRAGNRYDFFQPVRPQDIITATWKVVEAYAKHGQSGDMVFAVIAITYTNQRQETLAVNHETLVFR
jgi:acyl dehydratase